MTHRFDRRQALAKLFDEALIATAQKDGSGYLGLMTFEVQAT